MAGSFTIMGMSAGLQGGEKIMGPVTATGAVVIGTITDLTLATGDNTFTVPTGSTACTVFFPSTNTATLKVRTNLNSTDGGLQVNQTGPFFTYPYPAGTTSLVVNASVGGATLEVWFI